MKAKAVHKLGDEELTIEVDTLRKRMFELKNQSVTEKIQDTSQYGKIRKDIARLLSEQSVRSMSTQGKASSQ
jgi:ribosomal protein L29